MKTNRLVKIKKQKRKFNIWDKVLFKNSYSERVYTVYSYMRTKYWEVKYSIFSDNEYANAIEQWQIKKYNNKKIWLNVQA